MTKSDIEEGIELHLQRYDEFELLYPEFYHEIYKEIDKGMGINYDYDRSYEHRFSRVKKIDMNSIYDTKRKRRNIIQSIITEAPDHTTTIGDFFK